MIWAVDCRDASNPFISFKRVSPLSKPGFQFATVSDQSIYWLLQRNCSATPVQMLGVFVFLCGVSLLISSFFWAQGASLVLPFAVVELSLVAFALTFYARHASDGEKIFLRGSELVVELEIAGRSERAAFRRDWVRVEPLAADGSLIELSGHGQRVQVGRYVRPELRANLAREIRTALARIH